MKNFSSWKSLQSGGDDVFDKLYVRSGHAGHKKKKKKISVLWNNIFKNRDTRWIANNQVWRDSDLKSGLFQIWQPASQFWVISVSLFEQKKTWSSWNKEKVKLVRMTPDSPGTPGNSRVIDPVCTKETSRHFISLHISPRLKIVQFKYKFRLGLECFTGHLL